jgi:hypothetical protein
MGIDFDEWIKSNGETFYPIRSIFNQADPLGLLKNGWSEDEYDVQIILIVDELRLRDANSEEEIHEVIYNTFFEFYDEGAGKKENYQRIARLIKEWKKQ